MKSPFCLLLFLLFTAKLPAVENPNFLIIMTDDQSWVGTSTQMDPNNSDSKSDYYQTPAIDKLFKKGKIFSYGYAPGTYCIASRFALQSG